MLYNMLYKNHSIKQFSQSLSSKIIKPISSLYKISLSVIISIALVAGFIPTSLTNTQKALADETSANLQPNGVYYIKSQMTNRNVCMDIVNSSKDAGASIQSYGMNYGSNQQFELRTNSEGYFYIKNVNSGLFVTYTEKSDGSIKENTDIYQDVDKDNPDTQQWKLYEDGSIRPRGHLDFCLEVNAASTADGRKIDLYKYRDQDNFKFTLVTITDFSSPDSSSTTNSGAVSKVTFNNYKNRGINNSSVSYGPINFNDIDDGATTGRTNIADSQSLWMAAVRHDIIPWSQLAWKIIGWSSKEWEYEDKDKDEAERCMYDDYKGNGYTADFGDKYTNVIKRLNGGIVGIGGDDDLCSSNGLCYGSSLQSASNDLFKQVQKLRNGKLSASDFKKQCQLDALDDSTARDVIYSNAVVMDKEGGTFKYHYTGFGIAFYDFQVNLLSSEDEADTSGASIPYHTDTSAEGDGYFTSQADDVFKSSSVNWGNDEIESTVETGIVNSETESMTNGYEESVNYGASVGLTLNFGSCILAPNDNTSESAFSVDGAFTFDQCYANSFESSNEMTEETSHTVDTSVTVPAHCLIRVKQTTNGQLLSEAIDVPVGITYKVAIYSCNGEFYDDNAATHYTDTAGYDANSFFTSFGDCQNGDANAYGDAHTDLYNRGYVHKNDTSYDESYGNISTYSRRYEDKVPTYVNWEKTLNDGKLPGYGDTTVKDAFDYLTKNYPMSMDGAHLSYAVNRIDSQVECAVPLYPIKSIDVVDLEEPEMELQVGDSVPIGDYELTATDAGPGNVEFYGFDKKYGSWKLVDTNGNIVSSDIATINQDPNTKAITLTANKEGDVILKYFIDEDYYYYDYEASGTLKPCKNSDIDSQGIKVHIVPNDPLSKVESIEIDGSANVYVGQTYNLNAMDGISVSALDSTDKEVETPLKWEAREASSKGITVSEDGTLVTSATGEFHVRAKASDEVYSDWVTINSKEEKKTKGRSSSNSDESSGDTNGSQVAAANDSSSNAAIATGQNDSVSSSANTSAQSSQSQVSQDLFAIAMAAFDKVEDSYQNSIYSTTATGSSPTVTNIVKNADGSLDCIINGQAAHITKDSVEAKMMAAGLNIGDAYAMLLVYDIYKKEGKISADVVNQVEVILNQALTPQERSQNQTDAYAYGKAAGWI